MNKDNLFLIAIIIILWGYSLILESELNGRSVINASAILCIDTDNGVNTPVFGNVQVGDYGVFDHCLNSSNLFEYYCASEGIAGIDTICSGRCYDGACVDLPPASQIIACEDSDAGRNPGMYGLITLTYDNHSQFAITGEHCVGPRRVAETYCSPGVLGYTEEAIYCPVGINCTNGSCG